MWYSHQKAMIGGGAIIECRPSLGAVLRRQFSQPSRQSISPSSLNPTPSQRAMSFGNVLIFLGVIVSSTLLYHARSACHASMRRP